MTDSPQKIVTTICRWNVVNYDGPDESVECVFPGCANKLRRSDFNEPQFCSKEHRDAAAASLAAINH